MLDGHAGSGVKVSVAIQYSVVVARKTHRKDLLPNANFLSNYMSFHLRVPDL